jgi:hypothetical protein
MSDNALELCLFLIALLVGGWAIAIMQKAGLLNCSKHLKDAEYAWRFIREWRKPHHVFYATFKGVHFVAYVGVAFLFVVIAGLSGSIIITVTLGNHLVPILPAILKKLAAFFRDVSLIFEKASTLISVPQGH